MTPKERVDKRAKEMHPKFLKEIRKLESDIIVLKAWISLSRQHGMAGADELFKVYHWKLP